MKAIRKVVIFVNAVRPVTLTALEDYLNETGIELVPVVLIEEKIASRIIERNVQNDLLKKIKYITVDFDSEISVRNAINSVDGEVITILSQYENSMHEYQKLIPFFPYLQLPNETTITWSTEKKYMRDLVGAYNPNLVPRYIELHEVSDLPKTEKSMGLNFPVIVKPSGLEGSLLVTKANNQTQLAQCVKYAFSHIDGAYKTWIKRQKPFLLVEEFMEGEMYSIDAYIDKWGKATSLPLVQVITGHAKGLNDFYGYSRITPAVITNDDEIDAQRSVQQCIDALGLKSITVHIELMRTSEGWKLIEIGPRIGGYRHNMYLRAWGINHIVNDIIHRAGETVKIPSKNIGHSCVLNIYCEEEGRISGIADAENVQALKSVVNMKQNLHKGDEALFARHNGDPVFEIELFNKNKQALENDIQFIEDHLLISVA